MKLILSSCDFRNEKSKKTIIDNLSKPIDQCKLLFIPNEKATHEAIHSEKYFLRMQEFGFTKERMWQNGQKNKIQTSSLVDHMPGSANGDMAGISIS